MAQFAPNNTRRPDKLRQTLQFLRDDGLLTFVDGHGTYTLRGIELLHGEVEAEVEPLIRGFKGTPEKKEYLIEVYARNRGWVKQAHDVLGQFCLCDNCSNTFLKDDKKPYIEVHHIIPLCDGGEEWIENLSVLCAHHHRMAHFAQKTERMKMQVFLLERTKEILNARNISLTVP